jgi:hypothetical protein
MLAVRSHMDRSQRDFFACRAIHPVPQAKFVQALDA